MTVVWEIFVSIGFWLHFWALLRGLLLSQLKKGKLWGFVWLVKNLTVRKEKADPPTPPALGIWDSFSGIALLYKKAPQNLVVLHFCMILLCSQILMLGNQIEHSGDSSCMLHSVWALTWEDWNSWGWQVPRGWNPLEAPRLKGWAQLGLSTAVPAHDFSM